MKSANQLTVDKSDHEKQCVKENNEQCQLVISIHNFKEESSSTKGVRICTLTCMLVHFTVLHKQMTHQEHAHVFEMSTMPKGRKAQCK